MIFGGSRLQERQKRPEPAQIGRGEWEREVAEVVLHHARSRLMPAETAR